MKTFPFLKTERLALNQLVAADIPKIVEYAGNPKIAQMTLNIPDPYAEKDAIFWLNMANQGFVNGSKYIFAIRQLGHKEFIGGIGLTLHPQFERAALGYWLAEPYWNRGYVTEAVGRVLAFGFNELKLNKIYATHLLENPASGKVMIKNGMIHEGILIDHMKKGNQYMSVNQYRLTKEEYHELRAARKVGL